MMWCFKNDDVVDDDDVDDNVDDDDVHDDVDDAVDDDDDDDVDDDESRNFSFTISVASYTFRQYRRMSLQRMYTAIRSGVHG